MMTTTAMLLLKTVVLVITLGSGDDYPECLTISQDDDDDV